MLMSLRLHGSSDPSRGSSRCCLLRRPQQLPRVSNRHRNNENGQHACTCICIHKQTKQVYTCIFTLTCTSMYPFLCLHTCMHAYIQTEIHVYPHVHMRFTHTFIAHITLHYITLHYITLHYITLHFITLHYVTLQYNPFHCVALHHITLHCTALH